MTTHELAKLLLAGENISILTRGGEEDLFNIQLRIYGEQDGVPFMVIEPELERCH